MREVGLFYCIYTRRTAVLIRPLIIARLIQVVLERQQFGVSFQK